MHFNISTYLFRLPKFRSEVNKLVAATLPSCITSLFRKNRGENWRSDQNQDIFLSRAEDATGPKQNTQSGHENRNLEHLNVEDELTPVTPKPLIVSFNLSTKSCHITTKSCQGLNHR